ncbi:MAG: hypothetical protein WD824_16675 [Cyclobacteriaceae bacterium]
MKTKPSTMLIIRFMIAIALIVPVQSSIAQQKKTLVFDTFHGQNARNAEVFNGLLPQSASAVVSVNEAELNDASLKDKEALVLFSLTKPLTENEKKAIVKYLRAGGSMLLIFDEERRTPLKTIGINDVITPFGMSLTEDAPVRHNCGAIAEKSEICADKRELPYSGGRSIKGGTVISKVNDEGNYVHSAYTNLPGNGKLIVMSDGMSGLLMGGPDGVRFSGTGPSDSKYWGKDSKVFMEEVFAFLLK